jgi:hypothetical protein
MGWERVRANAGSAGGDGMTDFVLAVSWTLAVLRNQGPYPVIALAGEQGSAKSSFSAILKRWSTKRRTLAGVAT